MYTFAGFELFFNFRLEKEVIINFWRRKKEVIIMSKHSLSSQFFAWLRISLIKARQLSRELDPATKPIQETEHLKATRNSSTTTNKQQANTCQLKFQQLIDQNIPLIHLFQHLSLQGLYCIFQLINIQNITDRLTGNWQKSTAMTTGPAGMGFTVSFR